MAEKVEVEFAKPKKVTDLDLAFGHIGELMPEMKDIPTKYPNRRKWEDFQSTWFFCGLKNTKFTMKPGINEKEALRHLSSIQRSFAPKHEHKIAAVAYLASLWFEDVTYERAKSLDEIV